MFEVKLGILGEDFALLLLTAFGQSALERWLAGWSTTARQVASGCWFGLCAALTILFALRIHPGVLLDVRGVVIAGAVTLAGPIAGAITVASASIVRVVLGGAGIVPGIGTSVTVALLAWLFARRFPLERGIRWPALLGLAAGLLQVAWIFVLPWELASRLARESGPILVSSFVLGLALLATLVLGERERIERERRLSAVLDCTPNFILLLDPLGRVLQVNRAVLDFFATDEATLRRERLWRGAMCSGTSDLADHIRAAVERAALGIDAHFEAELMGARDRRRTFEFQLHPIRDSARRVVMLLAEGRDVTDERAAQARLRDAETTLHQAQKMEAVGQLTGGLAHDFNNILAIIGGNLELLRGHSLSDEMRRIIDAAARAVTRAASLTQYLLAFSRKQILRPATVSMNDIAGDTATVLRRVLGNRISVRTDFARDLRLGYFDPHQLETALLNLAINARDAMPGGGILTISTANAGFDRALSEDAPAGDYLCLTVSDTGTGMVDEVLRRAVEPFFTTKPVGQGSGLGLSMVYGFAKQSGGHLELVSTPGAGTRALLYLPAARAEGTRTKSDRLALTAP